MKTILVNPHDRRWTKHRFVLWFGAYASVHLMVWADSLDDALDECIDYIEEHMPGLLCDDQVNEEFKRLVSEGMSEEEAMEAAEVDTTCGGNHGRRILSWEWGITAEDPTRKQVKELLGGDRPALVETLAG